MAQVTSENKRRWRPQLGLRARVGAGMCVLLAASWLAYLLLVVPQLRSSFREEQEERIELLSRSVGGQIEFQLDSAIRELEAIASLPAVASMDLEQIDIVLTRHDITTPTFLFFFMLDHTGTVVSRPSKPERRGADRSGRDYFVHARDTKAPFVGQVRRSTAGNRALVIGTPVLDDAGAVRGVLAGSLGLMDRNETLYATITEPASMRWPAEVYLLSAQGTVVASSVPTAGDAAGALGVAEAPVEAASQANEAVVVSDDGKEWMVSSFTIGRVGWRVVVRVPSSFIEQRTAAITRAVTIASLALFAAALAIALLLTTWLERPVNRLADALRAYGVEGSSPPVPVSGPRELRDAAAAFNAMIEERRRAQAEREALEAKLRRSQKLETVGTLVSGIAHEFNNLLMPIMWGAQHLDTKLPPDSPLRQQVRDIAASADRSRDLIARILTFSRSGTDNSKRALVNVSEVVSEALRLAQLSVPSSVQMSSDLAADAGMVNADAAQLHQVILNLCKNASDAIGGGSGTIEVTLRRSDAGDHVELAIRDDGAGMDPDTAARVFEPFFTTKGPGQGTGLGMSVVHGIITDHGGRIDIESCIGKGTCVRISLPRSAGPAETDTATPGGGRGERVLVIDDDEPIVAAARQGLSEWGYDVVGEIDPTRALARLMDDGDSFALVVCDNNMPGLSGVDLVERARARRPELKFVMVTGFLDGGLRERCAALGVIDVLEKPVTLEQLSTAVRAALDSGTTS